MGEIASKYPEWIRERFQDIKIRSGMSLQEVIDAYEAIFKKYSRLGNEQLKVATPEDRINLIQKLSIGALRKNIVWGPKTEGVEFIYLTHSGLRLTQKGKPSCDMFVFAPYTKDDGSIGSRLTRMFAQGSLADVYKELNPFTRYTGRLSKFKDGTLQINVKANLKIGEPVSFTPESLNHYLDIKPITVAQAEYMPSRKIGRSDKKYTDRLDWRVIYGMFHKEPNIFTRKDKTKGGVFNLVDNSIEDREPYLTPSGDTIYPGMTTWCAVEHLIYDDFDIPYAFYGNIDLVKNRDTKKEEAQMNCYLIMPLYEFPEETQGFV